MLSLELLPDGALELILLHLGLKDLASLSSCSRSLRAWLNGQADGVWRAAAARDPAFPRCGRLAGLPSRRLELA